MNKAEAGQKGGLATKAKYGASHFSVIGHSGGRPPILILPDNGASREIKNNKKGGRLLTGLNTLRAAWKLHPLFKECANGN